MCKNAEHIKFCTCTEKAGKLPVIHHKRSRKNKQVPENQPEKIYTWTLSRYAGKETATMDGMLMEPADQLNEHIKNTDLVLELNTRNCFDFDYMPAEGDCLEVRTYPGYGAPMSFIYTRHEWTIDQYNGFIDRTEKISSGPVTFGE